MMNVPIPTELEGFVQSLVISGKYRDSSEVVSIALEMLQHREQLRRDIQAGIEELDQGLGREADDVFARLMQKAKALSGTSVKQK
jgi:putative addiction module CopG family antidote